MNNNLSKNNSINGGGDGVGYINLPYTRQINGQNQAHPAVNATERASSAYGLAEYPSPTNCVVDDSTLAGAAVESSITYVIPIDDVTRLGSLSDRGALDPTPSQHPTLSINPGPTEAIDYPVGFPSLSDYTGASFNDLEDQDGNQQNQIFTNAEGIFSDQNESTTKGIDFSQSLEDRPGLAHGLLENSLQHDYS